MDDKELISKAMSLLGSRTSKKKAKSSRANGKLGGRPKKDKRAPQQAPANAEAPLQRRMSAALA